MNEQYSHDIFISFSFADQKTAEEIVNELTSKYGFSCWICTRDIDGGKRFKALIPQAIDEARVVVFIQSESALASREIPKEIGMAFDANKTIIPFKLDMAQPQGDLRYDLYGVEYIDATVPTWEQRVYELAQAVSKAIGKPLANEQSAAAGERLISTPSVMPKNIFCGREDVLEEISDKFRNGERAVFVQGIGGIGKTQIAKQYAKRNKADYDTIIYATYGGSLKELVISETPFDIEPEMTRQVLSDGTSEDDTAFFKRKLDKIKKLSSSRTLVIIDNFDVDCDEDLPELLDGKYHLLITTRCDYSRFYPCVKVGTIDSVENLISVFMQNYQGYEVEADDPDLVRLIELVNRHTYTIELLAQHMENSGQTAGEMIEALQKEGILSLNESVKTDRTTQIAYENLLKMFKVFTLGDEERRVLRLLSLMPLGGVSVKDFKQWAQLSSTKVLMELENRSWIVRNTGGVALHPIIRDVVRHELPATEENCKEFLKKYTDAIDENYSWHFTMPVKEIYSAISAELISAFGEINENTFELYKSTESLFSFSVRPKAAVDLAVRLFEYHKNKSGENSFDTGRAAFKVGWAYLFNLQLENALENAQKWLERSYAVLSDIELTTIYENAVYGHMLGNLSRVNLLICENSYSEERLADAKKYAEISVEINRKWMVPGDPSYPKLAGAYMQLADACIALKEYEKAMTLIDDAYDILCPLFGEVDPDTLHAKSRKSKILYHMRNYRESLELCLKNIDGYNEFYGEVHFGRFEQLLTALKCRVALKETEEAETLREYILKIGKEIFAEDSKQLKDILDIV